MKKILLAILTILICSQAKAQSVVFKEVINNDKQSLSLSAEDAFPDTHSNVNEEENNSSQYAHFIPVTEYNSKYKIIGLVNNEIISSTDLQSAINMMLVNSGIEYNQKTKTMIKHQVMQDLIDEKLKISEAKKNGINISEAEISQGMSRFASKNNMPLKQLEQILRRDGVDINTLRLKIEAELAWQKLVSKKMSALSPISQAEIRREKQNIEQDLKNGRYMISEIVIPAKSSGDVYTLASVLREDPRFDVYAVQFSQSASASRGGDLGWVNKNNLDKQIVQQLDKMSVGDVSDPIKIGDKHYILKLNAKYDPKTQKAQSPTDNDVFKYLQNKKADEFINRYTQNMRNKAIIEIRD